MGSPKKTISYRFDSVGNRVGMTDPDGGRFTYAYDAVNRISHLVNPQGDRTTYAYDPGGRRTVKKLANGTRASFSYDAVSNLTRLANLKSDGTTISSFNYRYDRVGNRTAVLEADSSRVTWSYDDTYQLTGEHRTGSHAYRDTYTYDPAGNRLLKVHDGARTTYSYDAANQLEWSEDASGRTTYTFDADGNQERVLEPSGNRTTTSWDYENRTTLVQLPSGIRNTMAYEPGGLRVKLEESTGTKKFVWDEQNYLAETDGNDDTQVVYTNEPRLYGNLVSQRRGTNSHWYHFDAIGSTRELTDVNELATDVRLYDAWGSTIASSGPTIVYFEFVGAAGYYRTFDAESFYIRARSYSPSTVRWSSVDPLSALHRSHRYIYANNSPLGILDPTGLLGCRVTFDCNLHDATYDQGAETCMCEYTCDAIDSVPWGGRTPPDWGDLAEFDDCYPNNHFDCGDLRGIQVRRKTLIEGKPATVIKLPPLIEGAIFGVLLKCPTISRPPTPPSPCPPKFTTGLGTNPQFQFCTKEKHIYPCDVDACVTACASADDWGVYCNGLSKIRHSLLCAGAAYSTKHLCIKNCLETCGPEIVDPSVNPFGEPNETDDGPCK